MESNEPNAPGSPSDPPSEDQPQGAPAPEFEESREEFAGTPHDLECHAEIAAAGDPETGEFTAARIAFVVRKPDNTVAGGVGFLIPLAAHADLIAKGREDVPRMSIIDVIRTLQQATADLQKMQARWDQLHGPRILVPGRHGPQRRM